jgi:propionyl-CoA carboxylase alpha chain
MTTNRDLLVRILRSKQFLGGDLTTDFLTGSVLLDDPVSEDPGANLAAALALAESRRLARTVQSGIPVAWRNVVSQPQSTVFRTRHGAELRVEWLGGRDGYAADSVQVVAASPWVVVLDRDSVRTSYDVAIAGDVVDVDWPSGHVALTVIPRFTDPADQVASGSLLAPMPGTVINVAVDIGAHVAAGQAVLVLEAMKMQHTVAAPHAGTVAGLPVVAGQQVTAGDVLAVVQEEDA